MAQHPEAQGEAKERKQIGPVASGQLGGSYPASIEFVTVPVAASGPISWLPAAIASLAINPRAEARQAVAFGDSFCQQGRFADALEPYQKAVQLQPDEAEYHLRLGIAAWQCGLADMGLHHLQEAIRLGPDLARAHEAIAQYYTETGALDRALEHSARAVELAPQDAEIAISRASVLMADGQSEAAWQLLGPLVAAGIPRARLAVVYGRIAPKVRRERHALEMIRSFLQSSELTGQQRASLHFTAAALLEGLGEWDSAFEHAQKAHALHRSGYDPARHTEWVQRQIQYFTAEKLHALPRASNRSRRPVFIIGMLRSGTSLVEQILASHPQVYGAGELNTLRRIALAAEKSPWAEGLTYPEYLEGLSIRRADELARKYLQHVCSLNKTARYVTDKMPLNFLYLGLITVLFPSCRVIHCTRDPLDTCLSCYLTQFVAHRHEFVHDLEHLALFYRDYRRLMAHWSAMPGLSMIEVKYEDLVSDLEGQTRRMLDFLELPWDGQCLHFYRNRRYVATASYDQVRRPIYGSSVGRWKHYERQLAPIMPLLAEM